MAVLSALAVLLVVAGFLLWLAYLMAAGPVPRHRVFLFAQRQDLVITPDNGALVIRYLATTRRWRTAGLTTGIAAAAGWALRDGEVRFDALSAFAGWFVGAVVAEWRVATAGPPDRHPAARLAPRLLRDHVGPVGRWSPVAGLSVAVVLGAWALADAATGGDVDVLRVLGLLVLAVAALGVPAVVGRHVLERRQPADLAPDVLAADDAVRRRSLHVLAGCALALVAWPSATMVAQVPLPDAPASLLALMVVLPSVAGGWVVARTPYRLQPHPRPVPVA